MSIEDTRESLPTRLTRGANIVKGLVGQRSTLSLIDQAIVSGTSFLTTIIVGRHCGSANLGLFALATSLLVFAGGTQTSLVSTPYTVFRSRSGAAATPKTRAGSTLVGGILLSAILFACAVAASGIISLVSTDTTVIQLAWILAFTLPFFLARELGRRFDFARFNVRSALLMDLAVSALQISLLVLSAALDRLSAAMAVAFIGAACMIVFSVWFSRRRADFEINRSELGTTIRRDWLFGRWLLADHVLCVMQMYAMHWLLTFLLGTSAAGIFAACAALAALANPFIQGAGNYLAPRLADAVATGTKQETMQIYWTTTLVLGVAVTGFTVVAAGFGNQLMQILYHDQAYAGTGLIVGALACRLLFSIPTIAADHAVVAMERPRGAALATLSGLVVTFVLCIPLIDNWGVLGAAVASLIGTAVESVTVLAVFIQGMRSWHWQEEHVS